MTIGPGVIEPRFASAISHRLLSEPMFPPMSEGFPFQIATVAVALPSGCRPPDNALRHRIATGFGESRSEAATKALAEGAERYALQFRHDMPAWFSPLITVGGPVEDAPAHDLALGAPGAKGAVTSVGAASGDSLESAMLRAVLEQLEHLHFERLEQGIPELDDPEPQQLEDVKSISTWLEGQLRRLDLRLGVFAEGYAMAAARCSDLDGGRATAGSAAGCEAGQALRHAAEEAVFHWRNMVALENRGIDVRDLTGADQAHFRRYRGASRASLWPEPVKIAQRLAVLPLPDVGALMSVLAQQTGRRARIFDMTFPPLGVFTAKCVVG
ncbi:MAG: hypothetical protein DI533_10080 [Cereibacter sphaeroides]|uniref:YcaO domain-containing protein n=1 Tax=Cereibacter sphaeroides TaxID=1063 RepID=A0A2W5SNB8_CERSP|nr:MAG: hypothetical protein DI533_10080 [Cereibacter sphaeroides]